MSTMLAAEPYAMCGLADIHRQLGRINSATALATEALERSRRPHSSRSTALIAAAA